mmetsp:Transcript_18750/g.51331  ORF Transcript_18750/g.51331 Transcript_18750/m.51331 type:complete len:209 (+) Transcript_18750:179-805(+)
MCSSNNDNDNGGTTNCPPEPRQLYHSHAGRRFANASPRFGNSSDKGNHRGGILPVVPLRPTNGPQQQPQQQPQHGGLGAATTTPQYSSAATTTIAATTTRIIIVIKKARPPAQLCQLAAFLRCWPFIKRTNWPNKWISFDPCPWMTKMMMIVMNMIIMTLLMNHQYRHKCRPAPAAATNQGSTRRHPPLPKNNIDSTFYRRVTIWNRP